MVLALSVPDCVHIPQLSLSHARVRVHRFAQKHSFGLVRTAALFSIAMDVLTAVEGGGSSKECEQVLKAALVSSVRARPVGDDPHFWPEHVQQVGAFFASTFFAHFRLYQFAFSTAQQHTEHHTQLVLETAVIQDFRGALSEDEWAEYHERLAAAAEAERVAAEQAEEARVAAIKAAEEERARAEAEEIRRELLQRKPATLDQAIEHMVAIRLEQEKAAIEAEYREREEVLLARIEQLTLKAAQGGKGGAAAGGEKKGAKAAAAAAGATAK